MKFQKEVWKIIVGKKAVVNTREFVMQQENIYLRNKAQIR